MIVSITRSVSGYCLNAENNQKHKRVDIVSAESAEVEFEPTSIELLARGGGGGREGGRGGGAYKSTQWPRKRSDVRYKLKRTLWRSNKRFKILTRTNI